MHLFIQLAFKGIYKFLVNPNERSFAMVVIKYGARKRFNKTSISFQGFKFIVPDARSFIWQLKEIFVDEYYRFESSNENPVIYDCGANVGTSCIYFNKNYPHAKITAFEANPNIAKILEFNLINNEINDVKIINKAVWIDSNGLNIGLENADGSSIHKETNKVNIESVRLKDYIEKEKQIDMLKIDIEGAEYEVLTDCRNSLSRVKNLFIEFHSYRNKDKHLSKILDILERAGFKYFIKQPEERAKPFINRSNKSNLEIDLQLNIFAYRS